MMRAGSSNAALLVSALAALTFASSACVDDGGTPRTAGDGADASGFGDPWPDRTPPECGALTACGVTCADLRTDPANCGLCGRTCVILNATAGCDVGECTVETCNPGYEDADGNMANGCEALSAGTPTDPSPMDPPPDDPMDPPPDDPMDPPACTLDGPCSTACRVAVHRSAGDGHLYTTDLTAASTSPFHVETRDYFQIYSVAAPGTRPVFLCQKGDGKYLITESTSCEVGVAPEARIGFWSPTETCGAVPLHRLRSPASGDHFFTLSAAERDIAIRMHGYVSEGVAGWVWR